MSKRIVHLEHDDDIECPNEVGDGQWTLYSFCSDHASFKHPDDLGVVCNRNEIVRVRDRKLATRLRNGLAHVLSYFEHGGCIWMRKDGPIAAGVEFQWDGVRVAGLLVWEHAPGDMGAKTFEDRAKDADCFLRVYTSWANGEGLYYNIEDEGGNHVDSCGGFYGCDAEHMLAEIAPSLVGHEFDVVGDADYLEDDLRRLVDAGQTAVQPVG